MKIVTRRARVAVEPVEGTFPILVIDFPVPIHPEQESRVKKFKACSIEASIDPREKWNMLCGTGVLLVWIRELSV